MEKDFLHTVRMRTMQRSIDIGIPPRSITSNINYSCELCAGAYFSGKMGGLNKAFDADSGLCFEAIFQNVLYS